MWSKTQTGTDVKSVQKGSPSREIRTIQHLTLNPPWSGVASLPMICHMFVLSASSRCLLRIVNDDPFQLIKNSKLTLLCPLCYYSVNASFVLPHAPIPTRQESCTTSHVHEKPARFQQLEQARQLLQDPLGHLLLGSRLVITVSDCRIAPNRDVFC